jgi:hypothetical protein
VLDLPFPWLHRHQTGEWGDVGQDDWAANDRALMDGDRLPATVRRAPTLKCTTSTDSQMAALIIQAPWNNDPPRVVRGLRTTPLGLWGTPSFNSRPIWKVEIRSAFAGSLGRSLGLGGDAFGGVV